MAVRRVSHCLLWTVQWLATFALLSVVDHSSAAPPSTFSSLAVVTPSNPNHSRRRASIDASSNGFVGSVTLGNGGDFEVACDCGANWTVQRRRLNPDRPNHTALGDDVPACPTPNSYKIRQLSRKNHEDDDDDDNDDGKDTDEDEDGETRPFNATQVISFLPLPSQLAFENISQSHLADIDGRATDAVLGTPGGDIGEFILALQVYEDHLSILRTRHNLRANSTPMATVSTTPSTSSRAGGGNLTADSVLQLLKAYLERTRPRKFYHRTSLDAIQHLQREIGHALNLDDPTTKDEARLLGRSCPRKTLRKTGGVCGLMHPMGIGDRHLRFILEKPEQYLINPHLVLHTVTAFFTLLWGDGPERSQLMLAGSTFEDSQSDEQAVLLVHASVPCEARGSAPTVRPRNLGGESGPRSVFVVHPQAARTRRSDLAEFFQECVAHAIVESVRKDSAPRRTKKVHASSFLQLAAENSGTVLAAGAVAALADPNTTTESAAAEKAADSEPTTTTTAESVSTSSEQTSPVETTTAESSTTPEDTTTPAATSTPEATTSAPPSTASPTTKTTPKPTTTSVTTSTTTTTTTSTSKVTDSAAVVEARARTSADAAATEATLFQQMQNLGDRSLQATLQNIAKGLPVFQVIVS